MRSWKSSPQNYWTSPISQTRFTISPTSTITTKTQHFYTFQNSSLFIILHVADVHMWEPRYPHRLRMAAQSIKWSTQIFRIMQVMFHCLLLFVQCCHIWDYTRIWLDNRNEYSTFVSSLPNKRLSTNTSGNKCFIECENWQSETNEH